MVVTLLSQIPFDEHIKNLVGANVSKFIGLYYCTDCEVIFNESLVECFNCGRRRDV